MFWSEFLAIRSDAHPARPSCVYIADVFDGVRLIVGRIKGVPSHAETAFGAAQKRLSHCGSARP